MKRKSESSETSGFDVSTVLSDTALERALAAGGLPAQGRFAAQDLPRLTSLAGVADAVRWQMAPDARPVSVAHPRRRWHVIIAAQLQCTCERCLEPVVLEVNVDRAIEFFASAALADEATAEQTNDDTEDSDADDVDFLSPEDSLSLRDLVEDELLLALPMAPKHPQCRPPLPAGAGPGHGHGEGEGAGQATALPFSGLKHLLKKP